LEGEPKKEGVMENTQHYDQRQAEFHKFVNENYQTLIRLKANDQREAFNELLLTLLPDTKRYLTRGLRIGISKGMIPHNKYRPEDLFDQLIIDVFDRLEEAGEANEFHGWLYQRAVNLLEDLEVEEEFVSYFYDNIDDYSRAELDKLKEDFSTDGDGDLILMDELDDISYKDHHYLLKNIYLDDAHEDLMALMDSEEGRGRTQRHLDTILFRLPPTMRSVFELANEQLFPVEDISRIKGLTVDQVEAMLDRTRELLRDSLKDRLHEY
jgi:DNA-directed RNA polymerase specialized sigma24 family protein